MQHSWKLENTLVFLCTDNWVDPERFVGAGRSRQPVNWGFEAPVSQPVWTPLRHDGVPSCSTSELQLWRGGGPDSTTSSKCRNNSLRDAGCMQPTSKQGWLMTLISMLLYHTQSSSQGTCPVNLWKGRLKKVKSRTQHKPLQMPVFVCKISIEEHQLDSNKLVESLPLCPKITRLQKRNALKPHGADAVEPCSCWISTDDITRHELTIYYLFRPIIKCMWAWRTGRIKTCWIHMNGKRFWSHQCTPRPQARLVCSFTLHPPTTQLSPALQSGNHQHRLISLWESPKPTMRGYLPTRFEVTAWGWLSSHSVNPGGNLQ